MDKEQALEKHSKIYESGTVLFYEGDPGSRIWVINEGLIQLSKRVCNEEVVLETLGPGEFCGEIALVSDGPQPVTATVVESARLIVVEAAQFEAMLRSNGELSMRMLRKLAGRLNEAQFLVTARQFRNTTGRVMLHLRREIDNADGEKAEIPVDLSAVLGLDPTELEEIIDRLVIKKVIAVDANRVVSIPSEVEFTRYLSYLELQDRYEYFEKE